MESLIHFRTLLEALNEDEYTIFWQNISSLISKKESLCTILFHHFTELHSKNQHDEVQNMNNILSQILNERYKDKINQNECISTIIDEVNEPLKAINISIQDVPNELVSEILSYSSFETYLQIQKVNRRMFIVSKSPIKFVELPWGCNEVEETDYCFGSYWTHFLRNAPSIRPTPITNYFNFRTIKSLHIDLDYLQYIHYRNIWDKFMNVEYLSIDCSGTKRLFSMVRPYSIHCLTKNNTVKYLCLTNHIDAEIHPMVFCELIPYFPHLQSLEINMWDQHNDIDINRWSDEDIAMLFPDLEALNLTSDGAQIADRIVKVIGHQLKHVALDCDCAGYSEKGWSNLTELMLYDSVTIAIINIEKTARNIRKVRLHDNYIDDYLTKLLKEQKELMYLEIAVSGFNESLITLLSSLNVSPLKIRLENYLKIDPKDFYKYIENIAVAVNGATRNDFMLIMDLNVKQKICYENMKHLSLEKCSVRLGEKHFMIRSDEYKMFGGYDGTWMI